MIYLQTPRLNAITEYMMGLIYPGRPIANVSFKVYGYMSMNQAVSFLNDFKLGHYVKIPPRSMFLVQVNTFSQKRKRKSLLLSICKCWPNIINTANHAIHHYKFITKNIKTFNNNTFGQYRITSSCYK